MLPFQGERNLWQTPIKRYIGYLATYQRIEDISPLLFVAPASAENGFGPFNTPTPFNHQGVFPLRLSRRAIQLRGQRKRAEFKKDSRAITPPDVRKRARKEGGPIMLEEK